MDVKPTSIMNYDLPPRYLDDGQNNDKDWKMGFDVAPDCPKDKPYLRLFIFLKSWLKFLINTQAVGMDSGVQFSLINFIENILQPTSSKMSPTLNLGL